tara:strand:+ start:502 stop:837 length:336 start_codon:yes stop_codon:yes gene_type:complete
MIASVPCSTLKLEQRRQHRFHPAVVADQLNLPFINPLLLADLSQVRIGAGQRAELADAAGLKAAAIIIADAPAAGRKNRLFDRLQVRVRYEETQLVHGPPPCVLRIPVRVR